MSDLMLFVLVLCGGLGVSWFVIAFPYISKCIMGEKGKRKVVLLSLDVVGCIISVLGMFVFWSYVYCSNSAEHLEPVTTINEYEIEQMSFNDVYYDNGKKQILHNIYVKVKKPDAEHNSVVIEKDTKYKIKWLFWKIEEEDFEYEVYPDEGTYKIYQYKDDEMIYKKEKDDRE